METPEKTEKAAGAVGRDGGAGAALVGSAALMAPSLLLLLLLLGLYTSGGRGRCGAEVFVE